MRLMGAVAVASIQCCVPRAVGSRISGPDFRERFVRNANPTRKKVGLEETAVRAVLLDEVLELGVEQILGVFEGVREAVE